MITMPVSVIPQNQASSCQRITFLRIISSGMEIVTIEVMKANAVPRGTYALRATLFKA